MSSDFVSLDVPLIEQEGRPVAGVPAPLDTPERILVWMARYRRYHGRPLPDGYVPPPGIDIEELLKKLPPDPPRRLPA